MDDHILQSRHEIKNADELETFREGFVGLCWLDGPNSLISMLYLSYLMWCGSWEDDVMFVCSVFRLPFLLHVVYDLDFYFGKRLTILFLVLGLVSWVVFAGWSWYWMVYLYRDCWQVQFLFDIVGHSTWPKENTSLTDDEEDVYAVVSREKEQRGVWYYT